MGEEGDGAVRIDLVHENVVVASWAAVDFMLPDNEYDVDGTTYEVTMCRGPLADARGQSFYEVRARPKSRHGRTLNAGA